MNSEAYKLTCHACEETVGFPTSSILDGVGECPKCGARLEINWAAARAGSIVSKLEQARRFEHPALVLRRAWLLELARIEQVYGVLAQAGKELQRRLFMAEKLLTVSEVAEQFGVDEEQFEKRLRAGALVPPDECGSGGS